MDHQAHAENPAESPWKTLNKLTEIKVLAIIALEKQEAFWLWKFKNENWGWKKPSISVKLAGKVDFWRTVGEKKLKESNWKSEDVDLFIYYI